MLHSLTSTADFSLFPYLPDFFSDEKTNKNKFYVNSDVHKYNFWESIIRVEFVNFFICIWTKKNLSGQDVFPVIFSGGQPWNCLGMDLGLFSFGTSIWLHCRKCSSDLAWVACYTCVTLMLDWKHLSCCRFKYCSPLCFYQMQQQCMCLLLNSSICLLHNTSVPFFFS